MDSATFEWAIRVGDLASLLERAERTDGIAERRFAIELVARALMELDPGSITQDWSARALALGVERSAIEVAEADVQPHAVRVPLLDLDAEHDFLRMFQLDFELSGSEAARFELGSVAEEAIANAIREAAERVRPPQSLERFRFIAARPRSLEGARIDGESLGAAVFVSAVAMWTASSVDPNVAITGALRNGVLRPVGSIERKVRATERARMRALIVPAEQVEQARAAAKRIEVIAVADVDALLSASISIADAVRDPERRVRDALAAAQRGWRGYRWASIAEDLARVAVTVPKGRPDLSTEVLARLAGARRHLGDAEGALRVLDDAETIIAADPDGVPDAVLSRVLHQRAMTLSMLDKQAEAARVATKSVRTARRARVRGELIKALGCLALVEQARGKLHRALASARTALSLTQVHDPANAARSRMYVLDALARLGRLDEAREEWLAAMREVEADSPQGRLAKESWVREGWAAALTRFQRWEEALEVLDHPSVGRAIGDSPLPGLLLRRHLGLSLIRSSADLSLGFDVLGDSPQAYGRVLEPGLRKLGVTNVLIEVQERADRGLLDGDARARAKIALPMLPLANRESKEAEHARALQKDLEGAPDVEIVKSVSALLRTMQLD